MKTKGKKKRGKGRKGVAKRQPKARRLRRKRKAARRPSALTLRPWHETADRVRGTGPPLREVEFSTLGSDKTCGRCLHARRNADSIVLWKYWKRGYWRQAKRRLCSKHGRSLAARLKRTSSPKDGEA
jgi:hypothetical protein